MKRSLFILAICLFSCLTMLAEHAVSGRLYDNNSREPLDYANVSLKDAKGKLVTGTITDDSGAFTLTNIADGTYELICSFVGYVDVTKSIQMKGQDVNVGKIYLSENTEQLQEVEVVAQGTEMRFELDKKVFSVDQSIASAGGSASEILANIPSVDVDQEGNISLRNSDAVEIWINGKPSGLTSENRAQILEQMPAESIKEIEVITNPSAKYSPEGTAGIINLVMKKDRKAGYYGSVNLGLRYCLAAPWTTPPGGNLGFNINFSKGIADAYLNVGYHYRTSNGGNTTDRYNILGTGVKNHEDIPHDSILSHLYSVGDSHRNGGGLFIRGGVDLHITDKSTLGFSGFTFVSAKNDPYGILKEYGNSMTSYLLTNADEDTLRFYSREEASSNNHLGGNAMIDYRVEFNPHHNLMLSATYFTFGGDNINTYTQIEHDTLVQEQLGDNRHHSVEVKADYEWKPTQQSRLEAGYQGNLTWRNTHSSANNIFDENRQELFSFYNTFKNQEQTHALYITYGNRFWDKFSVQVGLRGEYFMRHLESTYKDELGNIQDAYAASNHKADTAYFQLFPSAYISYSFDNGHELQLNYTRRVDRPRGHQINPRQNFSDSTNISFGNPDLLPTYSSSLELNYLKNWERHTLSAGVFYRFADGVSQNVKYMESANVMKNTFINVAKRQEVGIEVVGKNRFWNNFLVLTTSVDFYYNTLTAEDYHGTMNGTPIDISLPKQNIFAGSARINAQFMFTKTFSGQLSARYRSPRVVAQGTSTHSYSIDLGLRKTFFDRKLALAFNVRDLLNSRSRSTSTWGEGFWQYSQRRWNSREIALNITYSFGNMRDNKKQQRPDGMEGGGGMDSGFEDTGAGDF